MSARVKLGGACRVWIVPILCVSTAMLAGSAEARTITCSLEGKSRANREHIPTVLTIDIDEATGRAKINNNLLEARGEPPTFGEVARESAAVIAISWQGYPIPYGYAQRLEAPRFRIAIQKASGAARVTTSRFWTGDNPKGDGTCRVN